MDTLNLLATITLGGLATLAYHRHHVPGALTTAAIIVAAIPTSGLSPDPAIGSITWLTLSIIGTTAYLTHKHLTTRAHTNGYRAGHASHRHPTRNQTTAHTVNTTPAPASAAGTSADATVIPFPTRTH